MKNVLVIMAAVVAAGCPRPVPGEGGAVVLVGARVITQDPRKPFANAVAFRGGTIIAVGQRDEVIEAAGASPAIRTFPGGVIVPGLVDAHGHLAGLGERLATVDCRGGASEGEIASRLAGRSPNRGPWLLGYGWDQSRWSGEGERFPTAQSLDAVVPDDPVYLTRIDGHAAWVNTEALRRAGITAATADPPGGKIVRDATGAPTGVLVDAAMDLVRIPPQSRDELTAALVRAMKACAEVGLTAVHEAGVDRASFEVLKELDAAGRLPIRVYGMAAGMGDDAEAFLAMGPFTAGKLFELRAVKLYADGAMGSRGAALFEPYSDDSGNRGLLMLEPPQLEARVAAFAGRGFQVAVHAIGDRGNAVTLDALEKARGPGRHRVEHAQALRPEDLGRFKRAGIIASMQPTHATSDMRWAQQRLGPTRVKLAYAWKTVLDSGARLALGSDFPVESPDPRLGLYAARTRKDESGQPPGGWMAQEVLSGAEALAGFTSGAAHAAFAEGRRGMIRAGFDADLTVLSVDPVRAPPEALLDMKVLMTVVDGVDVFSAPGD